MVYLTLYNLQIPEYSSQELLGWEETKKKFFKSVKNLRHKVKCRIQTAYKQIKASDTMKSEGPLLPPRLQVEAQTEFPDSPLMYNKRTVPDPPNILITDRSKRELRALERNLDSKELSTENNPFTEKNKFNRNIAPPFNNKGIVNPMTYKQNQSFEKGTTPIQNGSQNIQKGYRPTQNNYQPIHEGYKPNDCQPIQNGYRPTQNNYQPIDRGYRPIQNGCQSVQNGYQSVQNGYRPIQNGYGRQPVENNYQSQQPIQKDQPKKTKRMNNQNDLFNDENLIEKSNELFLLSFLADMNTMSRQQIREFKVKISQLVEEVIDGKIPLVKYDITRNDLMGSASGSNCNYTCTYCPPVPYVIPN